MTESVLTNARSWASRLTRSTTRGNHGYGLSGRHDVHRFDGERPFVARGGATVGDVKATWSTVELSVRSTHVTLRCRPSGLFGDIVIERDDVTTLGVRPSELGMGIMFGDARPDVVFWPGDAREVLDELRDRGWPAGGLA